MPSSCSGCLDTKIKDFVQNAVHRESLEASVLTAEKFLMMFNLESKE